MKPHKLFTFSVVLFSAACGTIDVGIDRQPTSTESSIVNVQAADKASLNAQIFATVTTFHLLEAGKL